MAQGVVHRLGGRLDLALEPGRRAGAIDAQDPLRGRHERVAAVLGLCLEGTAQAEEIRRSPSVTADLLAIMRGLIDAAGARGEKDEDGLARRVRRAVLGYLGGPS